MFKYLYCFHKLHSLRSTPRFINKININKSNIELRYDRHLSTKNTKSGHLKHVDQNKWGDNSSVKIHKLDIGKETKHVNKTNEFNKESWKDCFKKFENIMNAEENFENKHLKEAKTSIIDPCKAHTDNNRYKDSDCGAGRQTCSKGHTRLDTRKPNTPPAPRTKPQQSQRKTACVDRVSTSQQLSSRLQVEYMQASVFTGPQGNVKPFHGFPDDSFVSELVGLLDERLMTPAMTHQIKKLLSATTPKQSGKVTKSKISKRKSMNNKEKSSKAGTTTATANPNTTISADKPLKPAVTSTPFVLSQLRALQLYNGHRESLTSNVDPLTDLIDAREPLTTAERRTDEALTTYRNRLQTVHNDRAAAFVSVCIHTGLLKKANTLLVTSSINRNKTKKKNHRSKSGSSSHHISDVRIYNALLHAWASESNYDAVDRLVGQMRTIIDIAPTLQSYAAILESLGRKRSPNIDTIERVLQRLQNEGFNLSDMTKDCILSEQQWYYINKSLRLSKCGFQLVNSSNNVIYDNDSLNSLNDIDHLPYPNPNFGIFTDESGQSTSSLRLRQQLDIECMDKVKVDSIESKVKITPTIRNARENMKNQKKEWKRILTNSFLRNRHILELKAQGDPGINLVPFLRIFDVDTYVNLMIQEIDTLGQEMTKFSPTMSLLQVILGQQVYKKFLVRIKSKYGYIEKVNELYCEYLKKLEGHQLVGNNRQIWLSILEKKLRATSLTLNIEPWSYDVSQSIGKFLYRIILADVKINADHFSSCSNESDSNIPAFYAIFRQRANAFHEEIKPHPVLARMYRETSHRILTFEPGHMPLLVPPMPWTNPQSGGSLLGTTDLVRHTNSSPHQMKLIQGAPTQQLFPVFDALNTVSSTPWRINKPILDLIINIFNSGGDDKLDVPKPTSDMERISENADDFSQMDSQARQHLIVERRRLAKQRKEMFSLWCTELYRLSIANKYRDEIFCFPHNLDFRGRVYACPPHFNHLGSDLARSILIFAKGKPFGEHGYNWLKIHLVNLTGLRKRHPNSERLRFANEMMEDIIDSAENPMEGRKWWQTSDEPWQTLACCQEIAHAERFISSGRNIEEFVSRLPIHQDGSCNGLQHYATLGRDQAGAESVNLCPFDTPKDVYSDVVEKVEKQRAKDAENGSVLAQSLEGFIRRKVIKQTIMTTVYGVTQYGAREQIRGQLSNIDDFPKDKVWDASFYLTEKTFDSLQEMFTSTKLIQDWLVLSAKLAAKISLKPMQWTTPIGWPIVQPYFRSSRQHKPKGKLIKDVNVESSSVQMPPQLKYIPIEKPNSMKQRNAFPPNFIHSLDSTHMMLTAIYCMRAGLTFVSVHDCFWTHATDVPLMNQHCRQQFVSLHSQPILQTLSQDMLNKFGCNESDLVNQTEESIETIALINHILSMVPNTGEFNIQDILKSTYFFS